MLMRVLSEFTWILSEIYFSRVALEISFLRVSMIFLSVKRYGSFTKISSEFHRISHEFFGIFLRLRSVQSFSNLFLSCSELSEMFVILVDLKTVVLLTHVGFKRQTYFRYISLVSCEQRTFYRVVLINLLFSNADLPCFYECSNI